MVYWVVGGRTRGALWSHLSRWRPFFHQLVFFFLLFFYSMAFKNPIFFLFLVQSVVFLHGFWLLSPYGAIQPGCLDSLMVMGSLNRFLLPGSAVPAMLEGKTECPLRVLFRDARFYEYWLLFCFWDFVFWEINKKKKIGFWCLFWVIFLIGTWRSAFKKDELGLEIAQIALPAALALMADPIASLIDTAFIGQIGLCFVSLLFCFLFQLWNLRDNECYLPFIQFLL